MKKIVYELGAKDPHRQSQNSQTVSFIGHVSLIKTVVPAVSYNRG